MKSLCKIYQLSLFHFRCFFSHIYFILEVILPWVAEIPRLKLLLNKMHLLKTTTLSIGTTRRKEALKWRAIRIEYRQKMGEIR